MRGSEPSQEQCRSHVDVELTAALDPRAHLRGSFYFGFYFYFFGFANPSPHATVRLLG